jgi:UDPglucose 6-dehydrogenase
MKILIAGYGYVGKAIDSCLNKVHTTHIVDPKFNSNTFNFDYDAVIIAVATPQGQDGSCDMQNIFNCVEQVNDKPILIKSTISLEGWQQLKQKYPNKDITFSPEFLRANTAIEDFVKQETMFFSNDNYKFWSLLFKSILPTMNISIGKAEELVLAKYFRNSFLATKVSFFNQIYDLCKSLNISYSNVKDFIVADKRIGDSHSEVTTQRGFGGHCFPKDTQAILSTAETNNCQLSILNEAVKYNSSIRKNEGNEY